MASSSSNVVGVHYRVGKKIGEGSFGVIFEGTNLLNNQQVAIKFVRIHYNLLWLVSNSSFVRNRGRAMHRNYEMSTGPTRSWLAAVSLAFLPSPAHADLHSRDTECLLFWPGRTAQHFGH